MDRRTIFGQRLLPVILVAPQFLLTLIFFLWPACQAIWSSLTRQDPFGLHSQFAGLDNFVDLFTDPLYRASIGRTVFFMATVSALSMSLALFLAVFADRDSWASDLPDIAYLALRDCTGDGRCVVDRSAAASGRHSGRLAGPARHCLGLSPQRCTGDANDRAGLCLEAGQL